MAALIAATWTSVPDQDFFTVKECDFAPAIRTIPFTTGNRIQVFVADPIHAGTFRKQGRHQSLSLFFAHLDIRSAQMIKDLLRIGA